MHYALKKWVIYMYADYEYYKEKFGCLSPYELDEQKYNALTIQADAYIDELTMNRLKSLDEIPECVKNAYCAVIDIMAEAQSAKKRIADGQGDIASEKTGEESVSYSYSRLTKTAGASVSLDNRITNTICRYLSGTGLLYRGE